MKKISCPRMYFTVTTKFMKFSLATNPSRIPIMTAMINLNIGNNPTEAREYMFQVATELGIQKEGE